MNYLNNISKTQEHIWSISNLMSSKEAFNISNCFLIKGDINQNILEKTIFDLQQKYDLLRTCFRYDDGQVHALVDHQIELKVSFETININNQFEEGNNYVELTSEINTPFELSCSPLFRIKLFSFLNNKKILSFTFHRILIDSFSARNFENMVWKNYNSSINKKIPTEFINIDYYFNLVETTNTYRNSKAYKDKVKEWLTCFPDPNEKINLPLDFDTKVVLDLAGKSANFQLPNDLLGDLAIFSVNIKKSRSLVMLANYAILLHRLTNQNSVIIGVTQNLLKEASENVIGNFENTLPVRIDFSSSPTLLSVISQIENNFAFRLGYNDILYPSLIKNTESKKDLNINPFYQTSFNYIKTNTPKISNCDITELFIDKKGSRLDLSFEIIENEDSINFIIEYNTHLISNSSIERWFEIYKLILKNVIADITIPCDEIEILTKGDIKQLNLWNNTDKPFERNICIHSKFEQQAKLKPNNVALHWKDETLTYQEVNNKANQLSHYITSKKDLKNQIIGVCMDRSPEMIISLFAILKSGATYLPIDTSAPIERTNAILSDAKPVLILTKSELASRIPQENYTIIELDRIEKKLEQESKSNIKTYTSSDSQAYIIYTSGSTGIPKGVIIRHFSVINRISWMQEKYSINESDVLIQKTPITFDVSIWELFWWSFQGASLVLLPAGQEKDPSKLSHNIEKYKVTTIHFVPSMFSAFNSYMDAFKIQPWLKSLNTIFLSGESLPVDSVNEFYTIIDNNTDIKLINLYGPTEATVDVSYYDCLQSSNNIRTYIGKPINNTKLWAINRKNKIQPIGIQGELVIAGINLAKGYFNRPELNLEKFIQIPIFEDENCRIYKTGDIAKWTDIGQIDYLGRIDNQVKIRGFRIELGEIEAKIQEFYQIESCAVIVNKTNPDNPILEAYIKSNKNIKIKLSEIKDFLADKIPDYMIPTTFTSLPDMPLTPSGKLDRKALVQSQEKSVSYSDNENNIEGIILKIWKRVLKNSEIETSDNFFDVGGNSIMIPHIIAQLLKEHSIKVNTVDIFQYPTVESLSRFIDKTMGNKNTPSIENNHEKEKNTSKKRNIDHRVAIVGLAGKFPKADTIEEFWENLCDEKESLQFFTNDELRKNDATFEKNKDNPNYIKSRGILNNIEQWDAKFFGYSPQDAKYTDPQQRLWFETVWNALEDSGTDPYTYSGDIGVFAGVNLNSYLFDNILRNREIYEDYMHFSNAETFHTYVNNDPAFIATRTAYLFNLRGPAINVQSACSTSLTAVAQACASLISGESDMAVAGASSVQTPQKIGYIYQSGSMRSRDGHCRPFDKDGSGTVFSNAVGAVVLKRLDDAIDDKDEIYGVIKGWALNNDGNDKIGFAAPSVNGQLELLRKAQRHAGVHPEDICYIESHGTGTILGDPIEASALIQAFREKTSKKQYCGLGSSKGNFGHTDEVAGMVGLIKTALAAYHKKIPATINYAAPNPNIDFANSPFYVVNKTKTWEEDKPMIMGVSSFGVGGTNAHVILENFKKEITPTPSIESKPQIVTTSGKSIASLDKNIDNLTEFIINKEKSLSLSNIAYTTQLRKSHFQNKGFAIVTENKKLKRIDFISGVHTSQTKKKVFLFPGQGAQFVNMGLDLYKSSSVFKKHMDAGFDIFQNETGKCLKSIIFAEPNNDITQLNETQYTQPALFILSYSTAKLYETFGILPDETIGHSIGEYVSACLAGVFNFETALKIVIKRGQLMQSVPNGSMLAVRTSAWTLNKLKSNKFEIAAINAPLSCTICFRNKDQRQVLRLLKKNSIEYIQINTSHAFHSSQFDIILDEFEEYVNSFLLKQPIISFISCPTGDYAYKSDVTKGNYWAKQLRQTVHFNEGINKLHQGIADCVFIEVGPNTHLSSLTRQNEQITKRTKIISSIGRYPDGNTYGAFLKSLGNIWLAGITPNFKQFYTDKKPIFVKLPKNSFDKKRYWIDIDYSKISNSMDGSFNFEDVIIETAEPDTDVLLKKKRNKELTDTQNRLLKIWTKAIGTSDIEIDDNFFSIGGHSLLAVSLIANIDKEFGVKIVLKDFFENPTIEHLQTLIVPQDSKAQTNLVNTTEEPLKRNVNHTSSKKIIRGEI